MQTGPFTLTIDIGGSNVKASVLDENGALVAAKVRMPTPQPATPDAVITADADGDLP